MLLPLAFLRHMPRYIHICLLPCFSPYSLGLPGFFRVRVLLSPLSLSLLWACFFTVVFNNPFSSVSFDHSFSLPMFY